MNRRMFDDMTRALARGRSRRDVIAAAAGGLGAGLLASRGNRAEATGCLRIRQNLHSLDPAGPELTAYAQGIQQMKTLGEFQPLSWLYQANIHGTFTSPAEPIWNTCEHNTLQFWPWHRLYLVMFERIVRQASGYEAFALPFWDYADPNQRVLPAPFRDPTSPLYAADRNPDVNAGIPPLGLDAIFDHCPGFAEVDFDFGSFSLEGTPHGQVHVWVEGWMGFFETAGQDPIFWLHHANIDRLWESWLAQGGRSNPDDPIWLNDAMSFYDESGALVTMTTAQVQNTQNLCYTYQYLATCPPSPFPVLQPMRATPTAEPPTTIGEPVAEGAIQLGAEPLAVPMAMRAPVAEADAPPGPVVLNLQGVQGQGVLMVTYEIYVNLPEGQAPDHQSIYYVGNINLFGLQPTEQPSAAHVEHVANQQFNLSKNVAALQESGEWTGDIEITFVPLNLSTQVIVEAAPEATPEGPWVTIDQVTITEG